MKKKINKKDVILEMINVNKIYDMGEIKVHALKNANFSITSGEFVSIMGASGSGKSTLLNLLGCLDVSTSGKYYLDKEDVNLLNDDQLSYIRNKKIGFVFQSFNLLPRLTVFDNVRLPLTYRKEGVDERKISRAIDIVGLSHRKFYNITKLSGGEIQRVAIARAVVTDPVILLADEPTGNLDSTSGRNIMSIFKQINKMGATILVITHEKHIAAYGKRLIKIKDGYVMSDGRI